MAKRELKTGTLVLLTLPLTRRGVYDSLSRDGSSAADLPADLAAFMADAQVRGVATGAGPWAVRLAGLTGQGGHPAVSRSMAALSSLRDPRESFRYTLRRWYSMVFGLRNKAAAVSLVVRPSARLSAIWSS